MSGPLPIPPPVPDVIAQLPRPISGDALGIVPGDGSDVSLKLAPAIAWLTAHGGGEIHLRAGTYLTAAPINRPPYVVLSGDAGATFLRAHPAFTGGPIFRAVGAAPPDNPWNHFAATRDLSIFGEGANGRVTAGFNWPFAGEVNLLERCQIGDMSLAAIRARGGAATLTVQNCSFMSCPRVALITPDARGADSGGFVFRGCSADHITAAVIECNCNAYVFFDCCKLENEQVDASGTLFKWSAETLDGCAPQPGPHGPLLVIEKANFNLGDNFPGSTLLRVDRPDCTIQLAAAGRLYCDTIVRAPQGNLPGYGDRGEYRYHLGNWSSFDGRGFQFGGPNALARDLPDRSTA